MIKDILKEKNAKIDALLAKFDKEWALLSNDIRRVLGPLLKKGVPTQAEIIQAFNQVGTMSLVQGIVDEYNELIIYAGQVSKELGIPFVLTEKSLSFLEVIQEQSVFKGITNRDYLVNTMIDAGLQSEIEGQKFSKIVSKLEETLAETGRRIKAEVHTGMSVFDRTIKSENFKNVGIEKFIYVGPYDNVTRDECKATLEDPKQSTGWTRDDIEDSQVSFTGGGGYNCRHDWLPFLEEVADEFHYKT